jgi:hypothetical protein
VFLGWIFVESFSDELFEGFNISIVPLPFLKPGWFDEQ